MKLSIYFCHDQWSSGNFKLYLIYVKSKWFNYWQLWQLEEIFGYFINCLLQICELRTKWFIMAQDFKKFITCMILDQLLWVSFQSCYECLEISSV